MKVICCFMAFALLGISQGAPLDEFAQQKQLSNDPELTAGYFQGDIVLESNRNGIRNETKRWPGKIVYYKFHEEHFDEPHRNHVLRGMRIIEQASCIRFKEADAEQTYFVNITSMKGGCYSSVGWLDRVQSYNLESYPLDTGCYRMGTVVHEFLHTLGFYHMQSTSNRDDFVRIAEENIIEQSKHNFNKYDDETIDGFDQDYDYASILHYSAYAFSANGEMTIVPLFEEAAAGVMGQRREMTKKDINKLNVMYRCPIKN